MTLQQEAYEKIFKLPDDSIRLIIALIDKIQPMSVKSSSINSDNVQGMNAFQDMETLRRQSPFPKDIDYDEIIQEAIRNKYESPA